MHLLNQCSTLTWNGLCSIFRRKFLRQKIFLNFFAAGVRFLRSCGFNICMTTKSDIEQLFQSNYRAMLTLAIRLLHDPETARDIVHLTSSTCHPKFVGKERCNALMTFHEHCFADCLLVLRKVYLYCYDCLCERQHFVDAHPDL